jgi:hypothetical protein
MLGGRAVTLENSNDAGLEIVFTSGLRSNNDGGSVDPDRLDAKRVE